MGIWMLRWVRDGDWVFYDWYSDWDLGLSNGMDALYILGCRVDG